MSGRQDCWQLLVFWTIKTWKKNEHPDVRYCSPQAIICRLWMFVLVFPGTLLLRYVKLRSLVSSRDCDEMRSIVINIIYCFRTTVLHHVCHIMSSKFFMIVRLYFLNIYIFRLYVKLSFKTFFCLNIKISYYLYIND